MSRFTDHLGLNLLEYSTGRAVLRGDRCLWYGASPLPYERGAKGSGDFVIVPAFDPTGWSDEALKTIRQPGVTDLASMPRLVRGLLPPDGPWVKAAYLHDLLYVTKGLGGRFTRAQSDAILLEAMEVLGVPAWKRTVIYSAVRIGGGGGWGT